MKEIAKQMQIYLLYINVLLPYSFFIFLHSFHIIDRFLHRFCFLFVSLFRLFFLSLRHKENDKRISYATSKKAVQNQGTDSPPHEAAQQRQQKPVSRHLP